MQVLFTVRNHGVGVGCKQEGGWHCPNKRRSRKEPLSSRTVSPDSSLMLGQLVAVNRLPHLFGLVCASDATGEGANKGQRERERETAQRQPRIVGRDSTTTHMITCGRMTEFNNTRLMLGVSMTTVACVTSSQEKVIVETQAGWIGLLLPGSLILWALTAMML